MSEKMLGVDNNLDCWWHNFVEGTAPLEQQLDQARCMKHMIEALISLRDRGII